MSKCEYIVFDVETTVKNKGEESVGDFAASPFHPDNRIVLMGAKWSHNPCAVFRRKEDNEYGRWLIGPHFQPDNIPVLVGHNIKFDLHYLMHETWFRNRIMPYVRIWDTQLAEYLLTAQQSKFASLNSLSEKYGGTQKEDKIKEFWDNGVETEDIPESMLAEYCLEDVRNTEKVFLAQLELASELGMLNLIRTQMEALLATVEMEYNGMAFDIMEARKEELALSRKLFVAEEVLKDAMERRFPKQIVPNPDSKDHLSIYLFGGRISFSEYVQQTDDEGNIVCYKSGTRKGEPKLKKEERTAIVDGLVYPKGEWATKKAGIYSTADDVLSEIAANTTSVQAASFVISLMEYRKLSKDVGTYYKGYIKLVWPDGCIHGKINMTSTNTGRTSSSSPNMQNLSGKDYE